MALPYNLEVALSQGWENLLNKVPDDIATAKGVVHLQGKTRFELTSLKDHYWVDYLEKTITDRNGTAVDPQLQVLILHYLAGNTASLTGDWISFKELPGGLLYQEPFFNRAVRPLAGYFGPFPENLKKNGLLFGGKIINHGDAAVELYPFPMVPVRLIVWSGDEEFPPKATILFDASAPEMLATEDFAVLAQYLVIRLRKL